MYENFTYDQLKSLPDNQKIEALNELKTIYPDNKSLAQHLNVATIAISNMVAKYLEGKHVGRKKLTDEEKLKRKEERLRQQQIDNSKPENETNINNTAELENDIVRKPIIINPVGEEELKSKSKGFNIKLDKNMTGEEAINKLNGIANILLKENEYKVELVIEEV